MARYEYECLRCKRVVERTYSMGEAPDEIPIPVNEQCPVAHRQLSCMARRIMSVVGGRFGDTPKHHGR